MNSPQEEIAYLKDKVVHLERDKDDSRKWFQAVHRMSKEIEACQKELGYEEGDLLLNIQRHKAWVESELKLLRAGGERLGKYCEALQEEISADKAVKIGMEHIAKPSETHLPLCQGKKLTI